MERFPNIDQETKTNIVKLTGALLAVSGTGYVIYYFYRTHSHKKLIAKKRQELSERKRNLLTKLESLGPPIDQIDKITSMKLSALIAQLSSGDLSAIDVVRAFQVKSLMMDREYNFVTDLNPAIDEDVAAIAGVKKGALKGVPVSVKECFSVRGCDSTYGMLDRVFKPAERDDMMVRTLRMQGMVPFVTTNMCQTGYSIESSNPIYGQTVNPHCVSRTCGGSSGGEGAILACGASVVGLGSDIGGSIRIPASYCGVFGLKPTSQRFSHRHSKYFYADQNLIPVSVGPMARSIEDLVTFFKALACGDLYHLDPYCPPLCFNDKIFEKKRPLRIGWYSDLGEGQVRPVPAVVRAVEMAKSALTQAGHVVVPFALPDVDYAIFDLYCRCLFSDGGVGFIDHYVKRNPIDPTISLMTTLLKIPNCLKWFVSLLAYPINRNYSRSIRSMAGCSSIYELWRLKDRVAEYRERVLAQWQAERLDGIVCPVLPICAPPLGTSESITDVIGYTAIYNLLDYPAGSVPVTRVTQADVDELVRSYPRNTVTHRRIVEYQKDSVGMPIGVQCVSMLWREETCLRIMRDISDNI